MTIVNGANDIKVVWMAGYSATMVTMATNVTMVAQGFPI
jgi:hypothetical protein